MVASATAQATCQNVLWTQQGPPQLGAGFALVRDLDGDTAPDIAASVSVAGANQRRHNEIWFLSSRDGSWLPATFAPPPGDLYNGVIHLGDVDMDGINDFLVPGVYLGQSGLHALSGRTFQRLFHLAPPGNFGSWGYSIAADVDVDGDSRPNVLLTDPSFATVYAYDHQGQLLWIRSSPEPGVVWGPAVNGFVDFDGDGSEDFVVGVGEATSAGGAALVSGRTGQVLIRVTGSQPGDYLGVGVACCGDMDGDGRADIAAGGGSIGSPGSVQVFSSVTGQTIHAWYSGSYYDGFGWNIVGTLDVDQDGVADVIATAPGEPLAPSSLATGTMSIFSGRDGNRILRFTDPTPPPSYAFFLKVLPMPSSAAATFPRFLIGANRWGNERGRVYLFEGGPAGATTIAQPCRGMLSRAPRIGLRPLGTLGSRVTVSDAEPGMLAVLVLGTSSMHPLPLGAFGFTNCALHPDPLLLGIAIPGTQGLAEGYAHHDFARPFAASAALGLEVHGQWIVLGSGVHWPGGTSATLRWFLQ